MIGEVTNVIRKLVSEFKLTRIMATHQMDFARVLLPPRKARGAGPAGSADRKSSAGADPQVPFCREGC